VQAAIRRYLVEHNEIRGRSSGPWTLTVSQNAVCGCGYGTFISGESFGRPFSFLLWFLAHERSVPGTAGYCWRNRQDVAEGRHVLPLDMSSSAASRPASAQLGEFANGIPPFLMNYLGRFSSY